MRNPVLFQGRNRKDRYFEGWYFKQVCEENRGSISFIPGVSLIDSDRHAFIQVIIAPKTETHYFRFDIDEFGWQDEPFRISIGKNTFSKDGITIDLHNETFFVKGMIRYESFTPIQTSAYSPGIMGPFSYIPEMECNHGVISMKHDVSGELIVNGQRWFFHQDRGYLEKDWGTSFPKRYLWVQANHFDDPTVSFMASVADIPMLGFTFSGLIANLIIEGKEYRFATYTGHKGQNIQALDDGFSFEISKGNQHCRVAVRYDDAGELKAPQRGAMNGVIKEGLGAQITITYQGKRYVSDYGGAEFVGY